MTYYDRYSCFRKNGKIEIVPFVRIDNSNSDIYILYDKSKMRMDMLSYKYYGDPDYGWLIMQANPHAGSMEYSIEDGTVIRIPYPLGSAKQRYERSISQYKLENK